MSGSSCCFLTCIQISQEKWHELCPWHTAPERKAGNTHPFQCSVAARWYGNNPRDSCGWVSRSMWLAGRPQGKAGHRPQESQPGTSPPWHGGWPGKETSASSTLLPAPQPLLGERKGGRVSETHHTLFPLSKQSGANALASLGGGRGQSHIVLKTEVKYWKETG